MQHRFGQATRAAMPAVEIAGADEETVKCSRCPQCNRSWQLPEPQSGYCPHCSCSVEVVAEDSEATWERREAARRRQIEIGKARPEYKRYLEKVPKELRDQDQPSTPNPKDRVSKRQFDRALGEWRRRLHEWDAEFGWGPDAHEALPQKYGESMPSVAPAMVQGLAQPAGLVTQSARRRNRGSGRGVGAGEVALKELQPLSAQPPQPSLSQQPSLLQHTHSLSVAPPLQTPQLPPPQLPPPTQPPQTSPLAAPHQPPAGDAGIVQLRLADQLGDTPQLHHFPSMVPDFSDYEQQLQQTAAATAALVASGWPCWGMPPADPDLLQAFMGQHQQQVLPDPETPLRGRPCIFEDGETPPPLEMQAQRLGMVSEEQPLERCRLTFELQDSGYSNGHASMRRHSPAAKISSGNPPCTPPRSRGMGGNSMRSPPSSAVKTPTTGWAAETPSPQRLHIAAAFMQQHQQQQHMQMQHLLPPAYTPWPGSTF